MSNKTVSGYEFKDVLREELRILKSLRSNSDSDNSVKSEQGDSPFETAHAENLTGLAFSGGGIRSATFNLGVLQALAKGERKGGTGLLSRFDYLSTVSGGGYIGSWLSALLHREAENNKQSIPETLARVDSKLVDKIQPKITTRPCSFGPEPDDTSECVEQSGFAKPWTNGFPPLEHAAVRYLRRYSNYLTPRLGLSGDTLALISLFLRNFVLLQLALITLVAAVLLLPYLVLAISTSVFVSSPTFYVLPLTILAGIVLLLIALILWRPQIQELFPPVKSNPAQSKETERAGGWGAARLMAFSVVLCTLAFWLFLVGMVPYFPAHGPLQKELIATGALGYLAAWLIGPGSISFFRPGREGNPRAALLKHFFIAIFAGTIFGLLVYFFADVLGAGTFSNPGRILPAISFIPPLILLILSFTIALHLGVARSLFNEEEREWWARLGGLVLLAATVWVLVFSFAFFSPPLFLWLGNGGLAVVVAWVTGSGVGAWIARGASTSSSDSGSIWKSIIMKVAPWLFIAGLGLIISYGLFAIIVTSTGQQASVGGFTQFANIISVTSPIIEGISMWRVLMALVIVAGAFLFITWRLDINVFSAHSLYRNRLVRAYLGASRAGKRNAHPFTGFDPHDDIRLALLSRQRPIPILNTTINMTGGDDLAWQTRRAASFMFTPQFVGYEAKSSQGIDLGGYRQTWAFGAGRVAKKSTSKPGKSVYTGEYRPWYPKASETNGLRLGTALAISGAAASPNMGYNTSPSIAALLTAFNLRLGYWAGNPTRTNTESSTSLKNQPWRKERAFFCAQPIISELIGSANGKSNWINLSDGGHFDNLGIYELVRRRCRFIVVTDAGCDPHHQFQDLANTIRKCWTDLGVHISFSDSDINEMSLDGKRRRYCLKHGSLGLIEYPDSLRPQSKGSKIDRKRFGLILYLKCSLTKSECDRFVDIRQYAETHRRFPHETTADQFFDENQFEAYRHLGFCVGENAVQTIAKVFDPISGLVDQDKVFKTAKAIYYEQKIEIPNMLTRNS